MKIIIDGQIKQVRVYKNGKHIANFGFEAIYRSYSYGFTHEVKMFYSMFNVDRTGHNVAKATYYNRTWECYEYQSCITSCLNKLAEEVNKEITDRIKAENGWKKLTEKRFEVVERAFEKDVTLEIIQAVKDAVYSNSSRQVDTQL